MRNLNVNKLNLNSILFVFCLIGYSYIARGEIKGVELINLPLANRSSILKSLSSKTSDLVYEDIKKIAFSNQESMSTRWHAIITMAQIKKNQSQIDLKKASEDSSWFIRNASLVALSEFAPEESFKVAQALIKDKALVVRSAAVQVFQKSKNLESRSILWKELKESYNFRNNQSLWIRSQIVEVLSENPLVTEKSFFADLLNDSDPKVAYLATFALEKLHGPILGKIADPADKVKKWQAQLKKNYIEI